MGGDSLDGHFITPRLWGIADTAPYMHDGRALSLRTAIQMHGGEGQAAAANFAALSGGQQSDLLAFLTTLRAPRNPHADLDGDGGLWIQPGDSRGGSRRPSTSSGE